MPKSYTSESKGISYRITEAIALYRMHAVRRASRIDHLIAEHQRLITKVASIYGVRVENQNVLDIGPGPFLVQSLLFSFDNNNVTAFDLDLIPLGISPGQYFRMFRTNGPVRTMKTIVRKAIGIDRAYRRELLARFKRSTVQPTKIQQGDVTSMPFGTGTFDCVHSSSVLHHVLSPECAIKEMARVAKPGGITFCALHPYTSCNGSLHPCALSGSDRSLDWAHLKPERGDQLAANAVLNKLRISEWEVLFNRFWPDCHIHMVRSARPDAKDDALRMMASGELQGYTVEELLCNSFQVLWRKPLA